MATRPIETSSDVNLVYVNTNLKTSIIVRTSLTDTVSHIKERVLVDHMTTNSWIGEIKIRALQVKRSGKFYTMPDSLTVGEIFNGLKGNWCLRAICSQISKCDEMQISYGEGLKTDEMEDRFLSSPDISSRKKDGTSSYKVDADLRSNGFSTGDTGKKRKRSVKKNSGAGKKSQNDGSNLEGVSVEESNEKAGSIDNNGTLQNVESDSKRSKRSKKAVKIQNLSNLELETRRGKIIQEQYMAGEADRSDAFESDKRNEDNALENAMADTFMAGKSEIGFFQNDQANHSESPSAKELNHGDPIENANAHGRKKRNKNKKGETAEKTLVSATEEKMVGNSQNILASVELTDDTVLNSGILTEKSEGITAKDSNPSATAVDTSDTMQEVKSEGKKRKKSKKKDAEIQDMLHLEHGIRQGESSEPFVEAVNTVEKEDEGRLSLNHDDKVMLLSQSKTPDCIEKELTKKPTSGLPDPSEASIVSDHKIADGTEKRKKKRDKKSAGINLEKPALEQANNGANVSSVLLNFDISEEVQIKQSDDGTKKKNIGNENQSFDTLNENFAVLANGNEILESNQAEENSEEGKKSKKRTKKSRASASDAQKNFPFKDQKISAEVSPVTEGSFSITGAKITYSEANVKLTSGNESKTNIVISQTEQTLEDDDTRKKNMGNDTSFPVLGKENEILESNQADKSKKDEGAEDKKSKKKRNKSQVTETDVQDKFPIKGSNITSSEANDKHPTGNENEANIVISQTEQTLENDVPNKKNVGNDADFPVLEKENEILESVQADKINKDKGVTGRKSEKKRKKSRVSESDVQENSPIKGANEKLSFCNENESNIVISQTEQTLDDDGTKKKNMVSDANFPVLEKGNKILESNQADKNKNDEGDEGKQSKKNRKKSQVTKSDVQGKFPIRGSSITSSEANEKLSTDFSVLEKENEILESVQPDKINKDKGVTGRKSEKKRKKSQVSESDVQENSPIKGANEKLSIGNENESNIVISQTEQTLDDDGTKKKNMVSDASFPVLGKENEILESNQAYKSKKDEGVEDKKSKKKRNKSQLTETDVQGEFSIRGSSITSSEANEKLPTGNENEANIMISQTEQTLEYDGTDKENMGNDAVFPVLEKENEILESVQADKINKDEGVTGRKSEKKRKKTRVSESDVQDNSPIKGANVKLPIGNENESNIVISQIEQTLDNDGTKKKNMVSDADCLVSVKGNEILESNLADKNNEGRSDEDKKSKKKRKNSQVTVSDVQECFPIKDKTIGAETKENFAIKGAHTVSFQVIPDKSEEHLKMVNEPAVVTDDRVIDFRLHFVHEKTQPKVASGDNVKVASQSNDEMETGRNVKKDVLPCTSALSDLHNSPRSSDKQDSENKSSLKEGARGMRSGDSKLNSQNLVKCSKKMVAASSHTENKNMSLAESSTETFPSNKRVKKRDLVLDANTKMVMKTPQEKSLKPQAPFQDRSKNSITNKMMLMKTPETKNVFTKSGSIFQDKSFITNKMTLMKTSEKMNLFTKQGSIFQDNGVEDEVGDNERTVTSDASTHDSSDSSSESGDSEEESEMSHNLNGSDDVKGISDSGMLEMSKILRNSEQFKKAKLIASQIESEPDELNLNSQPDS